MDGADFTDADLEGTLLNEAHLDGAILEGAIIKNQAALSGTIGKFRGNPHFVSGSP